MGIQKGADISRLRQRLLDLYRGAPEELGPFLSDRPLMQGTVYPLRRKCAKPSCRCARGEHHETIVLSAKLGGRTRLWTIREEQLDEIRRQTERYRKFRQARANLKKAWTRRERELLRVIDEIARARTQRP